MICMLIKIRNIFHLPLDSRHKRSTVSTLEFIIGEDQTCSSLNQDVYCNGPLTAGTSYMYDFVTPNKLFIEESCIQQVISLTCDKYDFVLKNTQHPFIEETIQKIHGFLL